MLGKFSDNFPKKNVQVQNLKEFRPKLFEEFQNTLQEDGAIVLHGAPGVGKTEFAKQYAYETKENYKYIGWINSKTESAVIESLEKMAIQLKVEDPGNKLEKLATIVSKKLKEEIGERGKALIIFNDAENEKYLEDNILPWFISMEGTCDIIVTSRSPNWNPEMVSSTEMKELKVVQAVNLIKSLMKNEENKKGLNDTNAIELAEALGMLPLTIVPAVKYIQGHSTFRKYIDDFKKPEKSSNTSKGSKEYVKKLVQEVLKTSLDEILEDINAKNLLGALLYLDPDNVPLTFLESYLDKSGSIHDAIDKFIAKSLIGTKEEVVGGEGYRTYSIHELYQNVLRDGDFLKLEEKSNALKMLLKKLNDQFHYERNPQTEIKPFPSDSSHFLLVVHVEKVLKHAKTASVGNIEYAKLLSSIGIYLYNQDRFKESIEKFEEAKNFIESKLETSIIAELTTKTKGKKHEKKEIFESLTPEQKELVSLYAAQILHNLGSVKLRGGVDEELKVGTRAILSKAYKLQNIFAPNTDKTLYTYRNLGRSYSTQAPVKFKRAQKIIDNLLKSTAFEPANMKFLLYLDKATMHRENAAKYFKNENYVKSREFWSKGIEIYEKCHKLPKEEKYERPKIDLMMSYSFKAICHEGIGDCFNKENNSKKSEENWLKALNFYYKAIQLLQEHQKENIKNYNKDDFQNFLNSDSSRDFAGLTKVHMKLGNYASAQYYLEKWQQIQQYLFSSQPNHPRLEESNKCKIEIEKKLPQAKLTKGQKKLVRDYASNIAGKIEEYKYKFEYIEELEVLLLHTAINKIEIKNLKSVKEKVKERENANENEAKLKAEKEDLAYRDFKASHELSQEGEKCLRYLKDAFIKKIIDYTNLADKKGEDSDEGKSALQIIGNFVKGIDSSTIATLATASANPIAAVDASAKTFGQVVDLVSQLIGYFQKIKSDEARRMLDILNNKEMVSAKMDIMINDVSSTIVYNWSEQINSLHSCSIKVFSEKCVKKMLQYINSGEAPSLPLQKRMLEGLNVVVKTNFLEKRLTTTSNQFWPFNEMITGCGIRLYCDQSQQNLPEYLARYTRKDKDNDHSDKYGYRWGSKSEVDDPLYQEYETETAAAKALKDYKESQSKCIVM